MSRVTVNHKINFYSLIALVLLCLFCYTVVPPAFATAEDTTRVEEKVRYHGNTKSKKFHLVSCRYYDCKNCTKNFKSKDQAIAAGFVPCKVCKP